MIAFNRCHSCDHEFGSRRRASNAPPSPANGGHRNNPALAKITQNMSPCQNVTPVLRHMTNSNTYYFTLPRADQGCARGLMSRESNLTRLWLRWVESESSRLWKSRIWVESDSNHADRHLSQSWVNWILLSQSWVTDFSKRKRQDLTIICNFTEMNQPTATFDRTPSLPPVNNFSQIR